MDFLKMKKYAEMKWLTWLFCAVARGPEPNSPPQDSLTLLRRMEIGFAGGQITDEELQRRFAAGELQGKTIKLNKKAARKRVASDSEEESGSDSESDASDAPVLTVSAAKRAKGITPEETVCYLQCCRSRSRQ